MNIYVSRRSIGRKTEGENYLPFVGHKNKSERFVARMVRGDY